MRMKKELLQQDKMLQRPNKLRLNLQLKLAKVKEREKKKLPKRVTQIKKKKRLFGNK